MNKIHGYIRLEKKEPPLKEMASEYFQSEEPVVSRQD